MCPQCGEKPKEWKGDICYKCHISTVKWGLGTLPNDRENNHTQRELQHEIITDAASQGREIQRVGERWI